MARSYTPTSKRKNGIAFLCIVFSLWRLSDLRTWEAVSSLSATAAPFIGLSRWGVCEVVFFALPHTSFAFLVEVLVPIPIFYAASVFRCAVQFLFFTWSVRMFRRTTRNLPRPKRLELPSY